MATIDASVDGRSTATYALSVAVNRALAGDTLQRPAAWYTVPVVVHDVEPCIRGALHVLFGIVRSLSATAAAACSAWLDRAGYEGADLETY